MSPWVYLLILIIVVALIVFAMTRSKGKAAVSTTEPFGIFSDLENQFTKSQRSLFHEQLENAIPINTGVDISGVNGALSQPDFYLPVSPDRDYTVFFQEDNNQFQKSDLELCQSARHPRNLRRAPRATIGCGWWYVENPNETSTGALGQPNGPLFDKPKPGGIWIWSLEEAAKLEDIKRCKSIKICDALSSEILHKQCGFCHELGHGIPITSTGKPKYPDADGGSCPEKPIVHANECPRPQDIVNKTKNDIEQSGSDFEYDIDGNVIMDGKQTLASAPVRGLCDPDSRGRLSLDCLLSLALSIGMTEGGAVVRLIRKQEAPNQLDLAAINYMRQFAGIVIPDAIFGKGAIDKEGAINVYSRIVEMQGSSMLKVREGAKYLAVGNENFDICYYEDTDNGPFEVDCMQREFRKAGCQLSGQAAPNQKTGLKYSGGTWKQMKDAFAQIYKNMSSKDHTIQSKAVLDCLGTKLYTDVPEICEEPGIEYFVFSRANGNPEFFMGRVISRNGLMPDKANGNSTMLGLLMERCNGNIYVRCRTNVTVPKSEVVLISGWHETDAVRVILNGSTVTPIRKQTWKSTEESDWPVTMVPRKRNLLEIIFNKETTNTSIPATSEYISNNASLFQMTRQSWRPVISIDFFANSSKDANDVVSTGILGGEHHNYMSNIGSRKCLTMRGSYTGFHFQGIHSSTVGSICCMLNIQDLGNNNPMLFTMNQINRAGGPSAGITVYIGNSNKAVSVDIRDGTGTSVNVRFVDASIQAGQWIHFAMVFHGDRHGIDVYLNGVKRGSNRGQKKMGNVILGQNLIGDHGFKGSVAWFHIYDSYLTPQEVKRDMNYDNPDYVLEEPPAPSDLFLTNAKFRGYPGETIGGKTLNNITMDSKVNIDKNTLLCADECQANERCVAFTYSHSAGNQCSLKETIGPKRNSSGIFTGIMSEKPHYLNPEGTPSYSVDIAGIRKDPNSLVWMWKDWNGPNQRWIYDDKNRIVSQHSGYCLNTLAGSKDSGAMMTHSPCTDGDHQKWDIDNAMRLHPRHDPEKCLTINSSDHMNKRNGGRIYIDTCSSGANQKWDIRAGDVPPPST
jgi:hypothetical protein